MTITNSELVSLLSSGMIGVLPTDTLYGVVGSAVLPLTVERIYKLKGRKESKPFIVLISDVNDLKRFEVSLDDATRDVLNRVWPGAVSVILPACRSLGTGRPGAEKFKYLHRGTEKIAFRLPDNEDLRRLIGASGPLVAPSANAEGEPPAKNISEAKKYFGKSVDFYIDGGELSGEPSTLIELEHGTARVLRAGAGKINL